MRLTVWQDAKGTAFGLIALFLQISRNAMRYVACICYSLLFKILRAALLLLALKCFIFITTNSAFDALESQKGFGHRNCRQTSEHPVAISFTRNKLTFGLSWIFFVHWQYRRIVFCSVVKFKRFGAWLIRCEFESARGRQKFSDGHVPGSYAVISLSLVDWWPVLRTAVALTYSGTGGWRFTPILCWYLLRDPVKDRS